MNLRECEREVGSLPGIAHWSLVLRKIELEKDRESINERK
jgi:hypothetical protein